MLNMNGQQLSRLEELLATARSQCEELVALLDKLKQRPPPRASPEPKADRHNPELDDIFNS
jgi:hypothetical protein